MTRKERIQKEEQARHALALVRFEVIAPTLGHDPFVSVERRLRARAVDPVTLPDGRRRRYSWKTLAKWRERYMRGGLDALKDDPRQDRGVVRGISTQLQSDIERLLASAPGLKTAALLAELRAQSLLRPPEPGRATLYRFIGRLREAYPSIEPQQQERLAFEASYANQLWQADILYGPKISRQSADGRWSQADTYLIAIIDDYSRLIVHGEFSFSQNLRSWFKVLKTACCKRGIPGKLYCDNGKVFRSEEISRICALMGTHLAFTPVQDAAAKGKIEAFFRGMRSRFLEPTLQLKKPGSLKRLNELLRIWLEESYHRQPHRGIGGELPIERWMRTSNHVRRMSDDDLDRKVFLFHDRRCVTKTGLIRWKSRQLETTPALAGEKVDLYYDPTSAQLPFVWHEGTCHGRPSEHVPSENYNRNRNPSKGDSQ